MGSKTVLITGGAGFIGSYIAKELLGLGHNVVVYDAYVQFFNPIENANYQSFVTDRFDGVQTGITFVRGDTRDKYFLKNTIKQYKPSHIIHLAGLPIMAMGDQNPEEAVSGVIHGTMNILDSIKDLDFIERFVYTSSSLVYGDFEYAPADEEHPKRPKGVYGGARLAGEILTGTYGRRFGVPYTIIRPSAVYGPRDVNRRVVQLFLENAFENKPIRLTNGGLSRHDFSFVEDVAHGFVLATFSEKALSETFNVTRGEGRSAKEISDILQALSDRPLQIESVPSTPDDLLWPERGALGITKAKELLGYDPKYSLEDGMKKYHDYMKKYYESRSR